MHAQPLTSYEERLRQYRKEVRAAVALQLLIGLPICFGLFWLVSASLPQEIALPLPWWMMAPIAWCILAVPPVMKSLPHRPQPEDIERDQALRRAAGIK